MHTTGTLQKASQSYSSKIAIAEALAGFSVRAVTIAAVARIRPADARDIFVRFVGVPSKSGQTPKSHRWFLGRRTLRLHSAFLLLSYASYRQQYEPNYDAHGIAFVLAYYNYQCLFPGQQPEISAERLALLINAGFGSRWRKIPDGVPSDFEADNVKILKCRKCALPHLVEAHQIGYVCEECQAATKLQKAASPVLKFAA